MVGSWIWFPIGFYRTNVDGADGQWVKKCVQMTSEKKTGASVAKKGVSKNRTDSPAMLICPANMMIEASFTITIFSKKGTVRGCEG